MRLFEIFNGYVVKALVNLKITWVKGDIRWGDQLVSDYISSFHVSIDHVPIDTIMLNLIDFILQILREILIVHKYIM